MSRLRTLGVLVGSSGLLVTATAHADVLEVGPGKSYAAPCAAIAAAAPGDIIEVDASGDYAGDVCGWSTDGLTIRGVGGRAHIDANGQNAQGKGIWVIAGDDTVIENIELSGATVPDENGAGIRQEGANLTIRNCYFHDNENGILAGNNLDSEILIEYSEFDNNGFGDGFTHNFYINHVKKFTLQYSYSHRASIGHLVKTRAMENHILYNRLTNEEGTASYELDVSNGGLTYVIGNLFQQESSTDNPSLLAYQLEGSHPDNPSDALFVVNNTFVNDRPNGGTFINVGGSVSTAAVVRNNIFMGPGELCNQGNAILEGNYMGDPMFVNKGAFDYQLQAGSPAVGAGVDPGMGMGMSLLPTAHYVHPADSEGRMTVDVIDAGAYELGGAVMGTGGGATTGSGGATSGSGGGPSNGGSSSSSGSGSGGESSSSSGPNGAADGDDGSDDGCGCRLVGRSAGAGTGGASPRGASSSWLIVLAGVGALIARRRAD